MPDIREIDLQPVVASLVRRWKLVAAATLVAMLVAGVVAWGVLEDEYSAEVMLQFSKSKSGVRTTGDDLTGLEPDTFVYYIMNNDVLNRAFVNAEFGLEQPPYEMAFKDFCSRVEVAHIRNTNLIRLAVTLPDPRLSAEVALFLADQGVKRNQTFLQEEKDRSLAYLANMVNDAHTGFTKAANELQRVRRVHEPERWEHQVRQLSEVFKQNYMDETEAFHSWKENQARLASLKEKFEGDDKLVEIMELEQSVGNSLLKDLLKDSKKISEKDALTLRMKSQLINYVYNDTEVKMIQADSDMRGSQAKYQTKQQQINQIIVEQASAMAKFAAAESEEDRALKELSVYHNAFDSLQTRYAEAGAKIIEERQDLGRLDLPIVPDRPSGPRRKLMVLIAGMIGCALSSFLVVLRDLYSVM
jgi:uncharacterized protein involved in exopolysaccharide biosynthesis